MSKEQYHIIKKIRDKLEENEEALLRQHKLNQILGPGPFGFEQTQGYNVSDVLRSGYIFNFNPQYGDPDGELGVTDLTDVKSREYTGFFSRWVGERSLTVLKILGRFI